MHNTCSNFGPVQPESTVAVWSTSTKPAMCPKCGRHGSAPQAGAPQAGAEMSVVITKPPPGLWHDDWDLQGPVDVVPEVLHVSHKGKILASPSQFKDIFTGEAIPNDRQFPEEIGQYPEAIPRMQQHLQAGHEGDTWF